MSDNVVRTSRDPSSSDEKLPSSETYDKEKGPVVEEQNSAEFDRYAEGLGDLQVLRIGSGDNVKVAKDGVTVLIPQPSDDPDDPLNWTWKKKHMVLLSLLWASLLTDFSMIYGTVMYVPQSITFNMSVPATANSISGALFLQGAGGLFAVPLIQRFGRLPVLFWSQCLCTLMTVGCALCTNYAGFTTFRTLQGFVNTAPQVVGLSVIHDIFFFHERPRRVNLWAFCLMGGPFLGPFVSAWIIQKVSWQADYGVLVGFYTLSTLCVIFLGDETLYNRNFQPQKRESGLMSRVKLLVGITGLHAKGRPTVWTVCKHTASIAIRPHIFFITSCFVMVLLAWVIGINTTVTQLIVPPPYSFSPVAVACSYIAPMIGAILGELAGHFFNDWLCARYIRAHNGNYVLENRLWGAYLPAIAGFTGLILYGQALQHTLPWIALLLGWSMAAFAMISATSVVSTYLLDSFPKHASLVASIINFWRTTGGFCVVYFQVKWIDTNGPGTTFGVQAGILGIAFVAGVVMTQIFGKKWRVKYAPPEAEN